MRLQQANTGTDRYRSLSNETRLRLSNTSFNFPTLYFTRHRRPNDSISRRSSPATSPTFTRQALEKPVVHILLVKLHVVPVVDSNGHALLRNAVVPESRQVENVLRRQQCNREEAKHTIKRKTGPRTDGVSKCLHECLE